MSRRPNHSAVFKAKVAIAAIKGGRPGRRSSKAGLPNACGSGSARLVPAVDVNLLHAKIGELTLENDLKKRHCRVSAEDKAEGLGAPMQIVDDTLAVAGLVEANAPGSIYSMP